MYLFTTAILFLTVILLSILLWKLITQPRVDRFCWHRLSSCDNFFITIITPDGKMHIIDIFIIEKNLLDEVKIIKTKSAHYLIKIPKGTSLNELRLKANLSQIKDNVITALFSDIHSSSGKLSPIFLRKEDQNSCLEMFGYLKQSLQYK